MSNVSAVCFGNAGQDLISREGKYTQYSHPKNTEIFTDKFEKKDEKKNNGLKAFLLTLAALAAVAGGLGWAVKNGKLSKIEKADGILDYVKKTGFTIGDKVAKGYDAVINFGSGLINKFRGHKVDKPLEDMVDVF